MRMAPGSLHLRQSLHTPTSRQKTTDQLKYCRPNILIHGLRYIGRGKQRNMYAFLSMSSMGSLRGTHTLMKAQDLKVGTNTLRVV